MVSLLNVYKRAITTKPIITQSIVTALLFASGDMIAQKIVERKSWDEFNVPRLGRMTLFGGFIAGPMLTTWYRFLERFIKIKNKNIALLSRVTLDQALFAPSFIAIFFTAQGVMEKKSRDQILEKLESAYPTALKNNYKLWPAVQIINFHLIPLQHRVLVVNTVAIGWNTYLSLANKSDNSRL